MSSGGKGGAASQSKNHYGTLAGAICWGPLDWLDAVIHNGNYLFQGSLTIAADVTDLTGSLLDPTLIAPGGYLKLYRGTSTQPADPALVGHPPYKDTVLLVGHKLFFGQDSGTAPNLQIIGGRVPRVPTSVVAAIDNVADDKQVNPIAAWAEILLDERGGGMDVSELDLPTWLASGHWCAQDQEHRDYTFCSPLIAEQSALRAIAKRLLDPFNGFCRRTRDGKLACIVYEWGVDPGGLPILDAQHWIDEPQIPGGDWEQVPTELLLKYTDRDFEFQGNTHLVPNARALQIRQVDDQHSLDRPDVTRAAQVHRHGVEYLRRIGTAPSTATIKVRQPFVDAIEVGDKIKIDTDPEPGGAGLAQLVRVERIEQNGTDKATLVVKTDNLVPATSYTPTWTPPVVSDEESPPLVYFLGVPLPPNAFGWPASVALLATRPDAKVVGFEAFFSTAHAGAFADLGQQPGFAVRAELQAGVSAVAVTLPFTELDGLNAPDAGLAANTPGGNATEAGDNVLLALIATLDGNGRVALGGDGNPVMEFVSIVDRATGVGLPAATFNYTVLRGRLGTTAQAWGAGAVAWIVPRANLVQWRHSLLSAMLGGVAYFRLVSFTPAAVDDTIPVPECSVNMLPATAPMYDGTLDGETTPDDAGDPNPVTSVTVTSGVEQLILRWVPPTNVPLAAIFIFESDTGVAPALPQFAVEPKQTFLFRTGLADGTTKNYWIEVKGKNGRRTRSGPYTGTVAVWPIISGITATIAAETAARVLADSTEVTLRAAADSGLSSSISSEASARLAADGTLTTNLSTEVSARAAGDSSEAGARAAGDSAVAATVTTEQTARIAADGSLAAEYVLEVATGGTAGRRVAGFRVTNLGGAGGGTDFIIQADKIALTNTGGNNVAAPFALVGGVVYINTALIQTASITDAMINDLLADKLTAGNLIAMVLKAAKTASDSVFFNDAYGVGSTFPAFCLQTADYSTSHNITGTEYRSLVTVYGWATSAGYAANKFGKSEMVFDGSFYSAFSLPGGGDYADVYGVFRINGGGWTRMAAGSRNNFYSGGGANTAGGAVITGLAGTDVIEFGCELVTPATRLFGYCSCKISWGNI